MTPPQPHAEPLFFGPVERPCFGWLHHPPARPHSDIGLVFCNPFGYEATSSHRSVRHFALAAVAMGVPALRFDYDGTGDSAGDDRDPGRWAAWLASVNHAADHIRHATGVRQVVLAGLRVGAAIAATVAGRRSDVAGLVAIAPIVSGKAWLRESKAFQSMMGFPAPPPGLELAADEQEVAGFVLTGETQASLAKVDLLALVERPASHILIVDRDDLPVDSRLASHLGALGARVEHRHLPGYQQMMLDAHEAVVPIAMIKAVSDWLQPLITAKSAMPPPAPAAGAPAVVAPGIAEVPVLVDTKALFGILASPQHAKGPLPALVLVNSGAIPHGGPSRLYVRLARQWAARGWQVLRIDISGIGDSPPRAGEPENIVYAEGAVSDVSRSIDYLRQQRRATRVLAAGLCSGAYHVLKAAVAGAPLERVAVVNPLTFHWKPGMSLAYPPFEVVSATAQYRRSLLQSQKLKKLFTGQVNLKAATHIVARRMGLWAAGLRRNLARSIGWPLSEDLAAELNAVVERGVAMEFIFSSGDPGEMLLREGAGWTLGRLVRTGKIRIQRIDGPNHSFTPVWSQTSLSKALDVALLDR